MDWSNLTEQRLFEPIIEAFSLIEMGDNRVTRVVLTPQKYRELKSLPRMKSTIVYSFDPVTNLPIKREEVVSKRFALWGADITIGAKNSVYSDRCVGYTSGENNNFIPIAVDINFMSYYFNGLAILVKSREKLLKNISNDEARAVETLREMISESEFRGYIKYGFISVKGKSGDVYQIPRLGNHTKVWRNGKVIEEVCVRIADKKIPLTDNVIAFKTIIESNEEEFKKMGNVYKMAKAA